MGYMIVYLAKDANGDPIPSPSPTIAAFIAWTNADAERKLNPGSGELAEAEYRQMEPGGWNK